MIKWTTPSLKCTIPKEVVFDYIILTLVQGDITLEKKIQSGDVTDGEFIVTFTQEETGQLNFNLAVYAQLNIINGEQRLATNIVQMGVTKNLFDGVLPYDHDYYD